MIVDFSPFFISFSSRLDVRATLTMSPRRRRRKNTNKQNRQIGNILVCIAVYANTSMRTVTNIFIVNLAIADLLVIILCLPPTVIWDVTETWFLGEAMCKVILYFQVSQTK